MVEGAPTSFKDAAQMKKLGSSKHNIIQPTGAASSGLPQVNRPPSTANSKILDGPGKTFSFNVQGQAALSGIKAPTHAAGGDKSHHPPAPSAKGAADQATAEEDERYKYLLKHGIVKKLEDEDKIIFAELPQIPGVLVVYRKPCERNANPERLNLDRRELTHMPLLEGEERLRLLNLQHNYITKVENLVSLPNLIFLDLYNNEIKEISHLHTVPTLRVLMLGKNHIERIRNLQSLTKLDVLDLHSNRISKIENLNHLSELRVLNLANNLITVVDNLNGLASLTELNLRRNAIELVNGLASCPRLQRLFLSNNRIARFENISSVADAQQLTELALDGNPIATPPLPYYKFCLTSCPHIKHIDLKKITPEFKASVEEGKIDELVKSTVPSAATGPTESPSKKSAKDKEPGEESPEKRAMEKIAAESNDFKTDLTGMVLEKATSATPSSTSKEEGKEEKKTAAAVPGAASEETEAPAPDPSGTEITPENLLKVIAQEWNMELDRLRSKYLNGYRKKDARSNSLVQSGHAEIEGDTMLFIYGNALEVLTNADFQRTVEQISFQYVRFDSVVDHANLPRLKKFQKLTKLSFSHNFLHSFVQLSRLECLTHLSSLVVEHNDLMKMTLSRSFIVYRFPHVANINGEVITEMDRQRSRKVFQCFDHTLSAPPFFTKKPQMIAGDKDKDGDSAERTTASKVQRQISKNNIEARLQHNLPLGHTDLPGQPEN